MNFRVIAYPQNYYINLTFQPVLPTKKAAFADCLKKSLEAMFFYAVILQVDRQMDRKSDLKNGFPCQKKLHKKFQKLVSNRWS